jgi:WD40 repeat protein
MPEDDGNLGPLIALGGLGAYGFVAREGRRDRCHAAVAARRRPPGGRDARPQRSPTLTGHSGAVSFTALCADGQLPATGGADGAVQVWRAGDGTHHATLQGHPGGMACLGPSPEADLLTTGGSGDVVHLSRPAQATHVATLQGHNSDIAALAVSPDGPLLAKLAVDGVARIWPPRAGATFCRTTSAA